MGSTGVIYKKKIAIIVIFLKLAMYGTTPPTPPVDTPTFVFFPGPQNPQEALKNSPNLNDSPRGYTTTLPRGK